MARMIRLAPPPKVALPIEGWELIATEAGHYATGLRTTIQVWHGDDMQMTQQLALAYPKSWHDFTAELAAKLKASAKLKTSVKTLAEAMTTALLELTGGVEGVLREVEAQAEARGVSQATELVELAADAELFHSPDGEGFATLEIDAHRETWPLRTKTFRRWLARRFYTEHDKAPGTQAIQDAINVLESQAQFDGPEYPVFTRLADHHGAIYLNLANEAWEAVEITATGWRVVAEPPVKFRRMRGMLPLPPPVGGGSLAELRPLLNISDDRDWILLKAWLIQALRPKGPYPTLTVHGEQGSAKSTLLRLLRALIDPNTAPLRAEPRDGRDLIIAATNGWIIGLDNLSHLAPWLSDALCRLSTGGGFATRELYTDTEEVLFDAQRPVILNGIEELATRGDLLDRAIILYLPAIHEAQRRPEAELWRDFEAMRAKVLGALLDAVSAALGHVGVVTLPGLPRMADFAVWAAAAGPALGYNAEAFMQAYTGNRQDANELILEASLLTPFLRSIAEGGFTGTATALLQHVNGKAPEETRRQKGWPGNAKGLSNSLRRLAPNLRAVGIDVQFGRTNKVRWIRVSQERGDFSASSPSLAGGGRPAYGS
jgi:hypothetical protein